MRRRIFHHHQKVLVFVGACLIAFSLLKLLPKKATLKDAIALSSAFESNSNGMLIVSLSNRTSVPIAYRLGIEEKIGTNWPAYAVGTTLPVEGQYRFLAQRSVSRVAVKVPEKGRSCRVLVVFSRTHTPSDAVAKVRGILTLLKLDYFVSWLGQDDDGYLMFGPEVEPYH